MREVAAERERPALLFSGGKDSIVLLRLAEKAFRPGRFPFPLLHVDTGHNFPEVIEFRDRRVGELGEELLVASVQESIDAGRVVEERGPRASRNRLQTTTLLDAIETHRFDACFGGARRDEERARAKERVISLRDDFGGWDPRRQRPELWDLYNTRVGPGEHLRVFPLIELDRARRLAVHPARGDRGPAHLPGARAPCLRARRHAARRLRPRRADRRRGGLPRVGPLPHGRRHELHRRGRLAGVDARRGGGGDRRHADHRARGDARRRPGESKPPWRTARLPATSETVDTLRLATAGSVDDGKSTLIGRLLYDAKSILRRPARAHRGGLARAQRQRAPRPRAADRRPARRARAGHHDRRRAPLLRDAAAALHPRRHSRARAVHAQHGHRRLDRRGGDRAGRRAPRRGRADAPARGSGGLLRVGHVVLAVNKMDLVDWSEEVFDRIVADFDCFASKVGLGAVTPLPMSALHGDNVVESSERLSAGTRARRCSSTWRRSSCRPASRASCASRSSGCCAARSAPTRGASPAASCGRARRSSRCRAASARG